MVSLRWITKDDKKIRVSSTGQPISSTDITPRKDSTAKLQSERVAKFALERAKEAGGLTRAGIEAVRQKRIERSVEQGEREEELNDMIDKILENQNTTPQQKFRGIQRFGQKYFRELTSDQNRVLARELKDLARQITKQEKPQPAKIQAPPQAPAPPPQAPPQITTPTTPPVPASTPPSAPSIYNGGRSPLASIQPISPPTPTPPERMVEITEGLSDTELEKLPATVREEILASRLARK